METILEQKIIDSLFSGQADAVADPATDATTYNYGRAGHLSSEQMRAITAVNDQFARNLTHTLGAWLRTQMQIMVAGGEQMAYSDFLSCLPSPSYVNVLRLEPLGGVGLVELNLTVAMTMIDMLLGGKGDAVVVREVSEIEDAVLASVLGLVLKELNAAWEAAGLRFNLARHESQAQIVRLMPPEELTLCLSLDLQMSGVQGLLNFCLPAVVLNTIYRRLSAQAEEPRKRNQATFERVEQLMAGSEFRVLVRLPVMRLASRSLKSLAVGQVLELPLPKNTMAEILVGGIRYCSALPVAKGEHRGALLQADAGALRAAEEQVTIEEVTG